MALDSNQEGRSNGFTGRPTSLTVYPSEA